MTPHSTLLVTLSGQDRPGITAKVTEVLSRQNATVLDIGLEVIHHLFSLSILFEMRSDASSARETLILDLSAQAKELDLKFDYQTIEAEHLKPESLKPRPFRYAVTLIADRITAQALHEVTQTLARKSINIDGIRRMSETELSCLELTASSSHEIDPHELKKELLSITQRHALDIAVQAEGLYRRAKKMIVLDLDSTLIQNEVIDEFAREKGVYDEVATVTAQAMEGKIDYDESLKRRCAKLKGLTIEQMEQVYHRISLTPGAEELVRVLKKLGYKVAIVSGGFTFVCERIRERLRADFAFANRLEIEEGRATGRVIPPIINAAHKAELLERVAAQEGIRLEQVIAVGDGANDLLMLEKAGLGIAFNAKPLLREHADFTLNQKNLKTILYLLGISGRECQELMVSD